jgi:hypothetical protein
MASLATLDRLHELFQQQSGFAGDRTGGRAQGGARATPPGAPAEASWRDRRSRRAHQLATAGLGFLQDGGDVGVVVVEYFAQQEGGAPRV